jgi:low affinity Fe/Cu permease
MHLRLSMSANDHYFPHGLPHPEHQNRDARAINLKLDDLIHSIDTAGNQMLDIEKLSDEEVDILQAKYQCVEPEGEDNK